MTKKNESYVPLGEPVSQEDMAHLILNGTIKVSWKDMVREFNFTGQSYDYSIKEVELSGHSLSPEVVKKEDLTSYGRYLCEENKNLINKIVGDSYFQIELNSRLLIFCADIKVHKQHIIVSYYDCIDQYTNRFYDWRRGIFWKKEKE